MQGRTTARERPLAPAREPLLVLFVDGVGLAPDAESNPFAARPLDALRELAGGALVAGCARTEPGRSVSEVDATLGVPGLPQSATGQTTLFTGVNAARAMARHVPAFPGPRLKAIIAASGVLARVRAAGRSVAFANAFTPAYLADLAAGCRRASVTMHAAHCAGVALRSASELERDQAVTWDFERAFFRRADGGEIDRVPIAAAGAHLAAIAMENELTLYETFLTDLAGHQRIAIRPAEAIDRLDAFVRGLLAAGGASLTIVLCSDHGNVEEPDHNRHTRNPVPVIAAGPLAEPFARMRSIEELTPAILRALEVEDTSREPAAPTGADSLATPIGAAIVAGRAASS